MLEFILKDEFKRHSAEMLNKEPYRSDFIGSDRLICLKDHNTLLRLYAIKHSKTIFSNCMNETRGVMQRVLYRNLLFYVDYVNNLSSVPSRYRSMFSLAIGDKQKMEKRVMVV